MRFLGTLAVWMNNHTISSISGIAAVSVAWKLRACGVGALSR